jgi:hypothetical protein
MVAPTKPELLSAVHSKERARYIRKSMDKDNSWICEGFGRSLIDVMVLKAVYNCMDMVEGLRI